MSSTAIPKGSTVLITGVNGYIASHVADQVIAAGYRVRGTVRSKAKGELMTEVYEKRHGPGKFESIVVPDMAVAHAFDDAVKGCSGIAHVATDLSLGVDPNVVVPPVLNSVKNLLEVAAAELSIKRFVYTSSGMAATYPNLREKVHVDSSSWNHAAVDAAWKPPPYDKDRMWAVYGASKIQSEQACFDFVNEKKPGFVLNTVLPNYTMGEILNPQQPGSSGGLIRAAWEGKEVPIFVNLLSQYMVDVKDVGRLHVAALVEPDVQNERLLAFSQLYNYNEVMSVLRKLGPGRNIPKNIDDESRDLSIIDTKRSIELLQRMGRPGFTSMEESIKENVGI